MSRFFAKGGSDSDSESTTSEGEDVPKKPDLAPAYAFSDEEEDVKRVVRSAKDKRYEELTNIIRQIKNHRKIRDMSSLLTSFEELTRAYTKALPVMVKEDAASAKPKFYIKCLIDIEDCVKEAWDDRRNLGRLNQKSLSTLRQKIRKYNRDFEDEINALRGDVDALAAEDELEAGAAAAQESDASDNEDLQAVSDSMSRGSFLKDGSSGKEDGARAKDKRGDEEESDDDEDSIDWGSDSDETTSSSDDEGKYESLVERFLKKNTHKEEEDKKQKREKKKAEKDKAKKARKDEEEEHMDGQGWTQVKGGGAIAAEKPKMFAKDAEITHALVLKKLIEIVAARGKKGTDRQEQIALLSELRAIAEAKELGPGVKAKVDFAIVAASFDYNPAVSAAMKEEQWDRVLKKIQELLEDLSTCEDMTVGENILDENESFEKPPYKIRGCILTVCERMDDEFNKILKDCDAHGPEYVKRLKDEKTVCSILEKVQKYLEAKDVGPSELCRIYLRRIEHTYYKFDPTALAAKKARDAGEENVPETTLEVMDQLCKYIYAKDNTDRLRTRAILCHIYHHALHDNWYAARDLMLMSHLQDTIQHSDPPTQILYNRAMVQVGLCSFRHAKIKDAHDALLDIQSGGRAKELLAQGLLLQAKRQMERSSEQEKIEKQRQMPFHMHINLELLECVYLVSAMLMEIPYMAAHEFNARRRLISKSFHHQLKVSERQAVVGPPESMREHVVAAARAMRNGKWKQCRDYIITEKMNAKVWDLFYQANDVREMLSQKIQEETLRTYLFTYSHVYDAISLVTLSEMFELDRATVYSIISKMIINEELMASLDEPSQTVVMHKTEPSRLQSLALQVADKVGLLVEYNERILEAKSGVFTQRNQQGFRQQFGGQRGQDGGGGRGGWNRRGRGGDRGGGGHHGGRDRDGGGGGGGRDRDGGGGGGGGHHHGGDRGDGDNRQHRGGRGGRDHHRGDGGGGGYRRDYRDHRDRD